MRDVAVALTRTGSGISCDYCRDLIYGTRVVCLECGSRFTFDFCDKPECVGCTIASRDDISSPHLPSHDFVKIRAPILHDREIGKVLRDAKAGLERARSLLEEMECQQRSREFLKEFEDVQWRDEKSSEDGEGNGGGQDNQDGEHHEDSETVDFPEKGVAPVRDETMPSPDSKSDDKALALTCLRCETPISRPCLYCIDCPGAS